MKFLEYAQFITDGFDFGIDSSLSVGDFQNRCAVNDLIALKLTSVSPKYTPYEVVSILREGGAPLADLVVCAGGEFGYGSASAQYAAAYLEEVQGDALEYGNGQPNRYYIFKHSYIVINFEDFSDYNSRYRKGSGIWGMFVHSEEQVTPNLPHRPAITQIYAGAGVEFLGSEIRDLVFRAVAHASPLERFLKLYHLLEIDFDVQIVKEINALGTDLKGIGKILKNLSGGTELDRLTKLVRKASIHVTFFETILKNICQKNTYHKKLQEMLFEYGKESNPYAKVDSASLNSLFIAGFTNVALTLAKQNANYEHLSKFTAYIIYRFRCSIAHARLGEYLLTTDDELLICEVAEPALTAILIEIYKP